MSQNYSYPANALSISAVGTNGSPAPVTSLEIGGKDPGGLLKPLSVDTAGVLNVNVGSSTLPTGGATSANQVIELSRLSGSLVPTAYDEIVITYVPSGAGVGQIATAVYKLSSSTVKTLTMSYDGSDRLSGVVAS